MCVCVVCLFFFFFTTLRVVVFSVGLVLELTMWLFFVLRDAGLTLFHQQAFLLSVEAAATDLGRVV